jgi:hypothetical protein
MAACGMGMHMAGGGRQTWRTRRARRRGGAAARRRGGMTAERWNGGMAGQRTCTMVTRGYGWNGTAQHDACAWAMCMVQMQMQIQKHTACERQRRKLHAAEEGCIVTFHVTWRRRVARLHAAAWWQWWHGGTATRRHDSTAARRGGAAAQRHGGSAAPRHGNKVELHTMAAQWQCFMVEARRHGGRHGARWHGGAACHGARRLAACAWWMVDEE